MRSLAVVCRERPLSLATKGFVRLTHATCVCVFAAYCLVSSPSAERRACALRPCMWRWPRSSNRSPGACALFPRRTAAMPRGSSMSCTTGSFHPKDGVSRKAPETPLVCGADVRSSPQAQVLAERPPTPVHPWDPQVLACALIVSSSSFRFTPRPLCHPTSLMSCSLCSRHLVSVFFSRSNPHTWRFVLSNAIHP